nr:hypothetical protein [Micromonospora tarapacensis]
MAEALAALGSPAADPEAAVQAPCPGGGAARTVRSVAGPVTTPPPGALASLAGGTPVVDTPELYAYRRDGVAVLVDLQAERILVSATTGCAG